MIPESLRDRTRWASQYLVRHPWVTLTLFVAMYGFHYVDAEEFRRITENPFVLNVNSRVSS